MNVKRKIKLFILELFSWVPDKIMLKIQYRIKTGQYLNLENPKRYTEKLQWYKLYYKDDKMAQCADKYFVRKYVKEKGYGDNLIKLLGVYDKFDDINFSRLPNKFVLKSSNGGGGNAVYIRNINTKINADEIKKLKKYTKNWLKKHNIDPGREWVYCVEKPRIIIEELLETKELHGLCDYKFFCFNGEISAIYYIYDRKLGKQAKIIICNENLEPLPYYRKDELRGDIIPEKPKNFEKMKEMAKILAQDFPHARIDLYNIDGKIYFGEITFFDGSGYMTYEPDKFDYILGEKFILPLLRKE